MAPPHSALSPQTRQASFLVRNMCLSLLFPGSFPANQSSLGNWLKHMAKTAANRIHSILEVHLQFWAKAQIHIHESLTYQRFKKPAANISLNRMASGDSSGCCDSTAINRHPLQSVLERCLDLQLHLLCQSIGRASLRVILSQPRMVIALHFVVCHESV